MQTNPDVFNAIATFSSSVIISSTASQFSHLHVGLTIQLESHSSGPN